MVKNDQREPGALASTNRAITGCGCSFAALCALPFLWGLLCVFLPEGVFWVPFRLAAVVWNGRDGAGGISGLWG
ncbi:hypothetical protein [Streptomyces sp. URMC 123]|uniref:hypothetical protein n=1 Tax=Streptomyces sp. URMC 123 TaxID=3423403 RepID=UPI003F1C9957